MSEYIEFTNEFGHRIQMSREEYQKKIIPYNLEMFWDDKDRLRQFAMELVRDEFPQQAAIAADRLLELYGPIESALNFRAVVHMQAREFDMAKTILLSCLERFPHSGAACTNLAKLYLYEGDKEKAFATLETGLVKEPNQENGLDMYVELLLRANQKELLISRLEDLSQRDQAWRPQFVLGKLFLQDDQLLKAMQMFTESIERCPDRDTHLIAVTGELGQAGNVYQLIQIAEKYWKPEFRYPYAGFNYANALLVTDQPEQAVQVLKAIYPHVDEEYRPQVEQFLSRLPEELVAQQDAQETAPATGEGEKKGQKTWWKFW